MNAKATQPIAAQSLSAIPSRLGSIDLLRGTVMIIMALDHVRDFIHRGAMIDQPTNLGTTTALLFMTRWVTHICAPAFALTAGIGAWLWWNGRHSRRELSRFLATRGLWLMLLEISVMRFAYYFSWASDYPILLLVLWSLGLSMVALAALIWLPQRMLMLLALATLLLHPLLDAITPDQFGSAAALWNVLHQVGAFQIAKLTVVTPYPLVPWVAVVALGFALGPLFRATPEGRRRWLIAGGIGMLLLFAVLRIINVYGDPVPWSRQPSALFTFLSFINVSKYPASPDFLLLTLGMVFLLLAGFDRMSDSWIARLSFVQVFGRVPLFFYILHFYLAHLLATGLTFLTYGAPALRFALLPLPSMGGPAQAFPKDFGYDLSVVYLVWLVVLAMSYPLCRRYADYKRRGGSWWLSYL